MGATGFERGVHEIGDGCFAYLQPDGSWGWSNAGLVTDGDEALLVDTLFDTRLTRRMLDELAVATPAARNIGVLVNTHANGDHCYGNELLRGARIVASRAAAEEMDELPPAALARAIAAAEQLGPGGRFLRDCFAAFDFDAISHVPPTETFSGELALRIGDTEVRLHEVGPAHTRGDVIVHVPSAGVVYTGDILFIDGTPIMWQGPVGNWIAACERIAALDVEVVVPGHGPLTNRAGALAVRDYLVYVRDRARAAFDAGLSPGDAARELALGDFARLRDAERLAVNVAALYREWDPARFPLPNALALFGAMAELAARGPRA